MPDKALRLFHTLITVIIMHLHDVVYGMLTGKNLILTATSLTEQVSDFYAAPIIPVLP